MSSVKLNVYQIPPTLTNEEFTTSFRDLKGFLDARLTYNEKINQIIGELEFMSYESADQAKKLMQSYKFPGASSGIIIQFSQSQHLIQQQQQQHIQQHLQQSSLHQQLNSHNNLLSYDNQNSYLSQSQPYQQGLVQQTLQQQQQQQQYPIYSNNPQIIQTQQQPISNPIINSSPNNVGLNQLVNNPIFQVPPNATNSLYIDGVPIDATHREVAHVFRPFPGYKTVRLIKKQTQSGREYYYCFADFENSIQSTIALNTLQSYRFDKKHRKCLKIMYANDPQKGNINLNNNPIKSYSNKSKYQRKIYKKR